MTMISGVLIGDKQLIAQLRAFSDEARTDIDQTTQKLGFQLEANIKSNYLSGQVFKRRTGRLASSITQGAPDSRSRFESNASESIYYVGTNVSYARPLFYGHPGYVIKPKNAKALHFTIGGVDVFAKSVNMPAKPGKNVLTMGLDQMKPMIVAEYQASLERTAVRVFRT